jgi:PAS domain S-box-containing protein
MPDLSRLSKSEMIERLRTLETELEKARSAEMPIKHRLAEAALSDSEARIRAILHTAVEGIATIDERGIIESVNPAIERMFGYDAEELIGRNVSLLMPSPYREQHDGYLQNYLRTGKAKIIGIGREVVGQRKDGSIFPMDLSVGEMRLAGRPMFTGIIRDITERKRLEREILEISGMEQRRIGQDLHDGVCQHLAGIELMSQVLEEKLRRKSKADGEQAAKISRHVREAIAQTKSLARGLAPVDLESNSLSAALQELAGIVQRLFDVSCVLEGAEKFTVRDPDAAIHLYRIAQEASNNAVKHGKAKKIVIRLQQAKNGSSSLVITDDGIGFKSSPKKTGMGLRIMSFRARMIGGNLAITPQAGRGTKVTCTFPNQL